MVKQIRKTGKEANAKGKMWIPVEDRARVRKEGVGLQDYWLDCWQTDPYGNRWTLMCSGDEAATDIRSTTKAKYRKQLKKMRMFSFEERKEGRDKSLWIRNLHGSKAFCIEQILEEEEESLDLNKGVLDGIEQKTAETLTGKGAESSSTSFHKLLKSSSTALGENEKESAAVFSFDEDEDTKILEPENASIKSEDSVVPAPLCNSKKKKEAVPILNVEPTVMPKDSAPAATQNDVQHVNLPANSPVNVATSRSPHATVIAGFSEWLNQHGRADCVKDLIGLQPLIDGANEMVLTDAIAHVKEKIDGLKNFGGYLRRAIENQWKPQQQVQVPSAVSTRSTGLQPLDKSGFLTLNNNSIEERLERPTGYCDSFQKAIFQMTQALTDMGLSIPEYWMGDVWGVRGQLSPISKYYESHGLDFSSVQPHLTNDYVIIESDKLPVICFLDTQTNDYELVVVSGRW